MEKMTAEYKGNLMCEVRSPSTENILYTAASSLPHESDRPLSPTDLLISALATCLLSKVGNIMSKDGVDLYGTKIEYYKEIEEAPVRRIKKIFLNITVQSNRPLTGAERKKLEKSAYTCTVRESLHPDIEIKESIEYL